MRIAITCPFSNPVNECTGGGIQTFIGVLEKGLVLRGHDVDIYTVGSSIVSGNKISIFPRGTIEDSLSLMKRELIDVAGSIKTFESIRSKIQDYDIVHNNQRNFYSFWQAHALKKCLTTMHVSRDSYHMQLAEKMEPDVGRSNFVAISNYMEQDVNYPFIGTVHNGVNINDFTFESNSSGYLAWLGRFSPKKGLKEAMELAKELQVDFKFAASPFDCQFGREMILLSREYNFSFLGQADKKIRNSLLGKAKAMVFPLKWDEPFGYTIIEAMACGTPVIAYNRGAVSELIIDGVTGFVCPPNDHEAMKKTIQRLLALPEKQYLEMRRSCRRHVKEKFSSDNMVSQYETLYKKIIESSQGVV